MFPSSEFEYEFRLIPYNAGLILDILPSRRILMSVSNPGQCADNPVHF